jgi:hypothetical protein
VDERGDGIGLKISQQHVFLGINGEYACIPLLEMNVAEPYVETGKADKDCTSQQAKHHNRPHIVLPADTTECMLRSQGNRQEARDSEGPHEHHALGHDGIPQTNEEGPK